MIGFDCDGPLTTDRTRLFFKWAATDGVGKHWSYQNYARTGDWISSCGGLSIVEIDQVAQAFYRQVSVDTPTAGAQLGLRRLADAGKQRYIITARSQAHSGETVSALHGPLAYPRFTGWVFGLIGRKAEMLRALKATHFLEDNVREATDAAAHGIHAVVFPMRDVPGRAIPRQLTRLEAEGMVRDGMSDDEWNHVTVAAWEEFVDIAMAPQRAARPITVSVPVALP